MPSELDAKQARGSVPVAPHEKAPERRRRELIEAAKQEFAAHGLAGARVQRIADRTNSNKALLYEYFGSKEGLYLAVLEDLYRDIRGRERELNLEALGPVQALETLVAFTFGFYVDNPGFVAILSNENLLGGRFLRKLPHVLAMNTPIIDTLSDILARGYRSSVFRGGLDATDLYVSLVALGFTYVANRHTLGLVFGRDLMAPANRQSHLRTITQIILRHVSA